MISYAQIVIFQKMLLPPTLFGWKYLWEKPRYKLTVQL